MGGLGGDEAGVGVPKDQRLIIPVTEDMFVFDAERLLIAAELPEMCGVWLTTPRSSVLGAPIQAWLC